MNLQAIMQRLSGKKALGLAAGLSAILLFSSQGADPDVSTLSVAILVAGFSVGQGIADHGKRE